jgi:hypothetical protein
MDSELLAQIVLQRKFHTQGNVSLKGLSVQSRYHFVSLISTGRAERGLDDNGILKPIHGCTRTSVVHGTVLRNEIFVFESAVCTAYILMGSEPPT